MQTTLDVMNAGPAGDTTVVGFDLSGFSTWVDDLMQREGAAAGEAITDHLGYWFAAIDAKLAEAGFEIFETLGDGLLARHRGVTSPTVVEAAATLGQILEDCSIGLPYRVGAGRGELELVTLTEHLQLWTGTAIDRCHQGVRGSLSSGRTEPATLQRDLSNSKLGDGRVSIETVLVICLSLVSAPTHGSLIPIVELVRAVTDAHRGQLVKVTHDDGGVLLRCHFLAFDDALRCQQDLIENRSQIATAMGFGIASGSIYHVELAGLPPTIVSHGSAINRAAKQAKSSAVASRAAVLPKFESAGAVVSAVAAGLQDRTATAGRADETGRLVRALSQPGAVAEIVASAGVGKTHLLRAVAITDPSAIGCVARPQRLLDPFWLCCELCRAIDPQSPALDRPALPGDEGLQLWGEQLLAVLERQGSRLMCIDDFQWADQWSRNLLVRLHQRGLARMLVARRPECALPFKANETLDLSPLTAVETGTLLALNRLTDVDAAVVARLSAGNPFHALQLARALRDGSTGNLADINEVLDIRLAAMSSDARATLRLFAISDRPLTAAGFNRLAKLWGLSLPSPLLGKLEANLFLTSTPGKLGRQFEVSHRLLTDRVLAGLPPSIRPRLHNCVAVYLTRLRQQDRVGVAGSRSSAVGRGEIARHWQRAERPARAAIAFGRDGLAALDDGAHPAAIDLLSSARSLSPAMTPHAILWTASRAIAGWGMGDVALAARDSAAAQAAIDALLAPSQLPGLRSLGSVRRLLTRPVVSAKIRLAQLRINVARAESGQFSGDVRAIIGGNLGSIIQSHTAADQAAARARGLAFVALLAGLARISPLARWLYDKALDVGGSARPRAYVMSAEAVWHLSFGRWSQAESLLGSAQTEIVDGREPQLDEVIVTLRALAAQMQGNFPVTVELFQQLRKAAELRGNRLHVAWGLYGEAMPRVGAGEALAAAPLLAAAQAELASLADRQSDLICLGLQATAAAQRGDTALALDHAQMACRAGRTLPPTNFGSLEGFTSPAIIAAEIAVAPLSAEIGSELRQRARAQLEESFALARRFARTFPIGRPRLAYARGLLRGGESRSALDAYAIGMLADAASMNTGFAIRRNP